MFKFNVGSCLTRVLSCLHRRIPCSLPGQFLQPYSTRIPYGSNQLVLRVCRVLLMQLMTLLCLQWKSQGRGNRECQTINIRRARARCHKIDTLPPGNSIVFRLLRAKLPSKSIVFDGAFISFLGPHIHIFGREAQTQRRFEAYLGSDIRNTC